MYTAKTRQHNAGQAIESQVENSVYGANRKLSGIYLAASIVQLDQNRSEMTPESREGGDECISEGRNKSSRDSYPDKGAKSRGRPKRTTPHFIPSPPPKGTKISKQKEMRKNREVALNAVASLRYRRNKAKKKKELEQILLSLEKQKHSLKRKETQLVRGIDNMRRCARQEADAGCSECVRVSGVPAACPGVETEPMVKIKQETLEEFDVQLESGL